jgi:hypothetical protein
LQPTPLLWIGKEVRIITPPVAANPPVTTEGTAARGLTASSAALARILPRPSQVARVLSHPCRSGRGRSDPMNAAPAQLKADKSVDGSQPGWLNRQEGAC